MDFRDTDSPAEAFALWQRQYAATFGHGKPPTAPMSDGRTVDLLNTPWGSLPPGVRQDLMSGQVSLPPPGAANDDSVADHDPRPRPEGGESNPGVSVEAREAPREDEKKRAEARRKQAQGAGAPAPTDPFSMAAMMLSSIMGRAGQTARKFVGHSPENRAAAAARLSEWREARAAEKVREAQGQIAGMRSDLELVHSDPLVRNYLERRGEDPNAKRRLAEYVSEGLLQEDSRAAIDRLNAAPEGARKKIFAASEALRQAGKDPSAFLASAQAELDQCAKGAEEAPVGLEKAAKRIREIAAEIVEAIKNLIRRAKPGDQAEPAHAPS